MKRGVLIGAAIAVIVIIGIIYWGSVIFGNHKTMTEKTAGVQPMVEAEACPCGCGDPLNGPDACGCAEAEKVRNKV